MDVVRKNSFRRLIENGPNQADEAISALNRVATATPQDADVWFLLGLAHFRLKRLTDSLEYFKHAADFNRRDATTFYYIGLASERLSLISDAIAGYRNAYRLNPKMTKAREKLIQLTGQDPATETPPRKPPRIPAKPVPAKPALPRTFVDVGDFGHQSVIPLGARLMRRQQEQQRQQQEPPRPSRPSLVGWLFSAVFVLGFLILGTIIVTTVIQSAEDRKRECQQLVQVFGMDRLPQDCLRILQEK